MIWRTNLGRRVWERILLDRRVEAILAGYREFVAAEAKKLSRCYCADRHDYSTAAVPPAQNRRAWAASGVWGRHVYSRVVRNHEAIEAWSQGIAGATVLFVHTYLDQISVRALDEQSSTRHGLIRELDNIEKGFAPGRRVRQNMSQYAIDTLLFVCSDVLPVLWPIIASEDDQPISERVGSTAVLVLNAEVANLQQDRMLLQHGDVVAAAGIRCELPDRVRRILQEAPRRDDGSVRTTAFRRRLNSEEREAVRVAAGTAAIALRLMFQISDLAEGNHSRATIHSWSTPSPEYSLLCNIMRTVWDKAVGKPELDGGLRRGTRSSVDEYDAIRNILTETLDLVRKLRRYLHPAAAACAVNMDGRERRYLADFTIREFSKTIVLRCYASYINAFVDRARLLFPAIRNEDDEGDEDFRKWRRVHNRILTGIRTWCLTVEASFVAGDPRPRDRRKGPFSSASRAALLPSGPPFPKIALETPLYVIDVPGGYERMAAPDAAVLEALVAPFVVNDHELSLAWRRLRRLVPLNFFNE